MPEKGFYRTIYSKLPESPRFNALSPEARLVFLTLKISRFNNSAGLLYFDEGISLSVRNMTGLDQKRYKKALGELEDREYIAIQGVCLWLKKAIENDPNISLENVKHRTGIQNIINSMPKTQIVLDFCDNYGFSRPFGAPSNGLKMGLDTNNPNPNPNPDPKTIYSVPADIIIEYLNDTSGHRYPLTKKTLSHITARWDEFDTDLGTAARLEIFYNVIRSRMKAWGDNPKMKDYIRPKTLFNSENFWNYVGQADSILKNGDEPF